MRTPILQGLFFAAGAAIGLACTPAQRQHVRTALEVNRCVTTISLRHLDAGDDMKDPIVIARIAAEIAEECTPMVHGGE